ncbi:MAG: N-acetylmuramoyl-L-alanine amidase [Verrucomicrobia bacterium]|nr:N-acetylmuramoyl-L-alanine amidase [Verrucomicrobiota bacterium]
MGRLLCFFVLFFSLLSAAPTRHLHRAKTQASIPQHARPLVILDAGHGGSNEGAQNHLVMEKRLTLTTTMYLKKYLEEAGYRVILTRSRDVFIPLPRRVAIANNTKAVLFVSVHYNASHNHEVKGLEVFYYQEGGAKRAAASKLLASNILSSMLHQTHAESRGVKAGNFHVIRETTMPAVLVEGGFITNREESMLLHDKKYLARIARGIAHGVEKYMKTLVAS